jgi:hypothetical protein
MEDDFCNLLPLKGCKKKEKRQKEEKKKEKEGWKTHGKERKIR